MNWSKAMDNESCELSNPLRVLANHDDGIAARRGLAATATFLDVLDGLRNGDPANFNAAPPGDWEVDHLPVPLGELAGYVLRGFFGKQEEESRKALEDLASFCVSQPEWALLPYVELLARTARRWLEDLYYGASAELLVAVSPSIRLDTLEREIETKADQCSWVVPLAITNVGKRVAQDVRIALSLGEEEIGISTQGDLAPGATKLLCEKVPLGQGDRVTIRAQFLAPGDRAGARRLENAPPLSLELPSRKEGREAATEAAEDNPFLPDLPLTAEDDALGLVQGTHRALLDGLKRHLASADKKRRLFILRGVRRSGKTSVLLGLSEELRKSRHIPVYVDIRLWVLSLQESATFLDGENLLYELADSAVRATPRSEKSRGRLRDATLKEGLKLSAEGFSSVLRDLGEENPGCHVVFLLDDLDWWITADQFKGGAKDIPDLLRRLVARDQNFRLVLVHEWIVANWKKTYEYALFASVQRCRFLDFGEVRQLASLLRPGLSELALAALWKLSGGWPGLVQLLLYGIQEKLATATPTVCDVEFLKGAVAELTRSKDYSNFFSYLLASFGKDEVEFLKWLRDTEAVEERTAFIKGLFFRAGSGFSLPGQRGGAWGRETLLKLGTKQILEIVSDRGSKLCRLRVGLLACPTIWNLETEEAKPSDG